MIWAALLGLLGASLVLGPTLLVRLQLRRLVNAFRREDSTTYWAVYRSLARRCRAEPGASSWLPLLDAQALLLDERWAEARAALEQIDAARLPAGIRVSNDNNLAWALAHAGDPQRGAELAQATLTRARGDAPEMVSYCLGTLGAALVLAHRPAEALPSLQQALAEKHPLPRAQAVRGFYLGEALAALGRADEAHAAWQRALAAAPASRYGKRAAGRLGAPPPPYR
jgi:tetratricopeptide (TPR) repeat protein